MAGSLRPYGTNLARSGSCEGVREPHKPQGEGADGWNTTSSECVRRAGSGRPTSAGKPGRYRNTGGEVNYEVGRPHEKSQAAMATQHKECTEKQASQQKQSGSGRMEQQKQSGSGRMEQQKESGSSRRRQRKRRRCWRRAGRDLDVR